MKKLLAMLLVLAVCFGVFAGCTGGNNGGPSGGVEEPAYKASADYIDMDSYKAYLKYDLKTVFEAIGSVSATVDAKVAAEKAKGDAAIEAATDVTTAKAAYASAATAMTNVVPTADGVFNLSGLTTDEKTAILGKIEAYGVRNGMLGMTLYENGGYNLINPRVTLGSENYIVGYGFGILAEGRITADLATEANNAWKQYYHTYETDDPGTANYLNDQGQQVGDFYGYIGASYYTTFMNSTKDGYEWTPELAATDPEPVVALDANGQSDTWRFEIRSGLKYDTNSAVDSRKAYKGRDVEPEDFLTAFKLLLNQANGYYRGTELSNQTGAASIKGAKEYYDSTKNANPGIPDDSKYDFSGVGIKVVTENGKNYLQFQLGQKVSAYFARYYISSSLYMPVPKSFIELVGAQYYLGFSEDKKLTPVDNSLSLGAYTLERWDSGQQVVYKKNPYYAYAKTKYAIEGIHVNILTSAKEDKEAVIKEFLANKLDVSGIPDTYLKEYSSDSRAKITSGDSCVKLNVNALDQDSWIKLFGENGTYSQTSKDDYWQVKPVLSNAHFRQGLSYALNRKAFADLKGCIPTVNYFSSNYLSDPEHGVSYNLTDEHKDAVAALLNGTDGYGYSLELARDYFRMALDELESDGLITPGTTQKPTVFTLECAWQASSQEESVHKHIVQYWTEAFNDVSVTKGLYKLEFKFWSQQSSYMETYNKMLYGQYDIGFGSITGNPDDPLSFFNVNSTDPTISNDFTLNWAIDTNTVHEVLVYNGKRWSFDALYQATQQLSIVSDGVLTKAYSLESCQPETKDDGSMTVTIKIKNHSSVDSLSLDELVIFGGGNTVAYNEWSLDSSMYTVAYDADADLLTIVVNIPKSEIDKVPVDDNQGIDVYFDFAIGETASGSYLTCYVSFSK